MRLHACHAITAADALPLLATIESRAGVPALPAVVVVHLHVATDAISAVLPPGRADALSLLAEIASPTGVPTFPAMPGVSCEHPAPRVAAGQAVRADLRAPTAVLVIGGEIGADAAAAALAGRAARAIAAVGIWRAGAAIRSAALGVVGDIEAVAVA